MTDDPFARVSPMAEPPDDRFPPPPEDNPFIERAERLSQFYSAAGLAGQRPPLRAWLVPDLVPFGTVTLLMGDGGVGKSLLALQLSCAVAAQRRWLGIEVAAGSVLFISAEDDEDELHRRLDDVTRGLACEFSDLDRLTLRSLAGEDALLAVLDRGSGVLSASALFAEVDRRVSEDAPALLVLDTLADLFPGDENNRAQARQFIGLLRGLAIRHQCAVLLLGHPSVSGMNSGAGTSGSTAWNNSVRSRLYFERVINEGYEADPDARMLSSKKANYSRTGGQIGMKWADGIFQAETAETGLDRMASTSRAERVFLKLLRLMASQGRHVNATGGSTYAPSVFAVHPEAEGVNKKAFRTAMESLLGEGKIGQGHYGPPSKRRSFLTLKD